MYHSGVFNLGPQVEWAAYTWADHELCEFEPDWTIRPLCDVIPGWLDGRRARPLDHWRALRPDDPFWTSAIYGSESSPASRLQLPTLHRGAWWDPFRRGQIADWKHAADSSSHPQILVMDATDHYDHPWSPNGEPVIDILADLERFVPYLPRYLDGALGFFDTWLRGDVQSSGGRPVQFHLANGPWHTSSTWPPPDLSNLDLHPAGSGGLALSADSASQAIHWVHDAERPVPSLREYWAPLLDLVDEQELADRDDVLTFTTEELRSHVDLAGAGEAVLSLRSSTGSAQAVVQLMDVFPDGRSLRISEGVAQARLDVTSALKVDLGPLGYRLLPGHRLRMHVASSSFPRYMLHPGSEADPWTAVTWRANDQQLLIGGPSGSSLRLAVLPSVG
jgi:putative CocE/NonD family hydrolase